MSKSEELQAMIPSTILGDLIKTLSSELFELPEIGELDRK
jgi:hypothetical protein